MRFPWNKPASASASAPPRRPRRMEFSWDNLEERKVLSHAGGLSNLHGALHGGGPGTSNVSATSTSTSTSSSSTLMTARQTLQSEIQTIELASGTTIGQLTAIQTAFQTLKTDGLKPTSQSALTSFENSLVTSFASGTTLAGDATLLSQFEALYTTSPTTQETTDLTTAYNALAAAVTSSNITSADITAINTDYAAVLAAEGSTSTATFAYFTLVTGSTSLGHGGGGQAGMGSC
jgi:hypothetical protein